MSYFLHAFFKSGAPGDPPEMRVDTVGCMRILSWEIAGLSEPPMLRVRSYYSALKIEHRCKRTMLSQFRLEPGNRFYVVKNNPKEVQQPNGPIIWRYEGDIEAARRDWHAAQAA